MANRANITSVEAVETFRAQLILYLSKARPTMEEIGAEVTRTRDWVQNVQMKHYIGLLKKRGHELEEARAAVFSSKLSSFKVAASSEALALAKAKRAYDEVEHKMRAIRRWSKDFDNKTDPLVKQLEKVNTILADDLTRALHYLTELKRLMDDYMSGSAPTILETMVANKPAGAEESNQPVAAAGQENKETAPTVGKNETESASGVLESTASGGGEGESGPTPPEPPENEGEKP